MSMRKDSKLGVDDIRCYKCRNLLCKLIKYEKNEIPETKQSQSSVTVQHKCYKCNTYNEVKIIGGKVQ